MQSASKNESIALSVVIVNHNTKALCEQTVEYAVRTTDSARLTYEIIIVDNSSKPSETYTPRHPNVRLIGGVENRGFGNACNIGAANALGKYLLFLNSDTILKENTLNLCVDYLETHSGIGALGIRTYLANGSFDLGCKRGFPTPENALYYFLRLDRRFPDSPKYGGYHLTYLSNDETCDVDAVSGAFMMMPRTVFDALGGFDEDYFMYGEDLDLCFRIKQMGYRVVYFAGAQMIHLKGQSGLSACNQNVVRHFHRSMSLFYDKHYRRQYPRVVSALVHVGIHALYFRAQRRRRKSGRKT